VLRHDHAKSSGQPDEVAAPTRGELPVAIADSDKTVDIISTSNSIPGTVESEQATGVCPGPKLFQ
jgi:hypothetical protein